MPNIIDRLRTSLRSQDDLVKFSCSIQIELTGEGVTADMPLEIAVEPYPDGDDTYVVNFDPATVRGLPVPLKSAAYALARAFVEMTVPSGTLENARQHNDDVRAAGNAVDARYDD